MSVELVSILGRTKTFTCSANTGRVFIAFGYGYGANGVTEPINFAYAGYPMTKIGVTNSSRTLVNAWYLVLPDSVAAGSYIISSSSSGFCAFMEVSGANLLTPVLHYGAKSTGGATSLTTAAINVKANGLVLDATKVEDPETTRSAMAGQTEIYDGSYSYANSKKVILEDGTTTMGWNYSPSARASLIAVSLVAPEGGILTPIVWWG